MRIFPSGTFRNFCSDIKQQFCFLCPAFQVRIIHYELMMPPEPWWKNKVNPFFVRPSKSITSHRHYHLFQRCLVIFFFFNFFLSEERLFWSSLVFVLIHLLLSQETRQKDERRKYRPFFCLWPSYVVSSISNLNYTVKLSTIYKTQVRCFNFNLPHLLLFLNKARVVF